MGDQLERFIVKDTRTDEYLKPGTRRISHHGRTTDINKARVFRSVKGIKKSLGTRIRKDSAGNPMRTPEGRYITYFPECYEIIPIELGRRIK